MTNIMNTTLILESLSKPIIRLESACFMWLVKK